MTHESICLTLRLAWMRLVIHSNKICSQSVFGSGRAKLSTLTFGPSGCERLKKLADNLSNQAQKACSMFTQQCKVIAGQRIWRAWQIACLYRQLYGEKLLLQKLRTNLLNKNRKLYVLLSAAGVFQWERDGISDEEMTSATAEMEEMEKLVDHAQTTHHNTSSPEGWEIVIDRDHLKVWRRHMGTHNLYEYRVFGTFSDISATAFYNTQLDLEFWSGWDRQTMEITVVDHDKQTSSEIIHWVYKFPYPMYPRDYLYVRRFTVDPENRKMVIRGRAVEHPKCPLSKQYVRVVEYQSQMVIEPHTSFDKAGFNYYLSYYDDPQTQLPSLCYNWLASTGVPDFVERLHSASKLMQDRMQAGYKPNLHNYNIEATPPSPQQNQKSTTTVLHNLQNYC